MQMLLVGAVNELTFDPTCYCITGEEACRTLPGVKSDSIAAVLDPRVMHGVMELARPIVTYLTKSWPLEGRLHTLCHDRSRSSSDKEIHHCCVVQPQLQSAGWVYGCPNYQFSTGMKPRLCSVCERQDTSPSYAVAPCN